MTPESLCMGCMSDRGPTLRCIHCGWEEGSAAESPLQLSPRTVLEGKYLIGRALGQGGFGITYLAWDLNLEFKLAIKEYFPRDICTRARDEHTVQPISRTDQDAFREALDSFRKEGAALGRFRDHPGIVSVLNSFPENGTGYLVMAYMEGVTFKEYLANHGERIPFDETLRILVPAMDALRDVHAAGMLHRDISPDNIYITQKSQVKLLDFGNARSLLGERSRSFSAVLKPGYAPEEQFRRQGRQGTWTDVYAMGATFYRALTGRTPPEAPERLIHDDLIPPSQLGVEIPARAERALLKALAVRQERRFQSIAEFKQEVDQVPAPPPPVPPPTPDRAGWKLVAVAAGILLLLIAAYLVGRAVSRPKTGRLTVTANVAGAKILIDGQTGADWLTPHAFAKLKPGPHSVTAMKQGYEGASQRVTVRAGGEDVCQLDLRPVMPPPSSPPSASASTPAPTATAAATPPVPAQSATGEKVSAQVKQPEKLAPRRATKVGAGSSPSNQPTAEAKESSTESTPKPETEAPPVPVGNFTIKVVETSQSSLEGVPVAAEVVIDDKSYGQIQAPLTISLLPGEHHYKVTVGSKAPTYGSFTIRDEVGESQITVRIPKD